jgi:hypothetical protein
MILWNLAQSKQAVICGKSDHGRIGSACCTSGKGIDSVHLRGQTAGSGRMKGQQRLVGVNGRVGQCLFLA